MHVQVYGTYKDKHLFDTFPIQNSLKQDDLPSLLVHENLEGMQFNGIHQLLIYAADEDCLP